MALDSVSDGGSSETVRDGGSVLAIGSTGAGPIIVPDNVFLLTAGFERAGADLRLVGKDGQSVLVKGYFAGGGTPADLETTTGAIVTGETAKILAGSPAFMQLAQAGGGAVGPAAIGKVTAVTGDVTVQRAGVLLSATGPEKVAIDTPIYRNDVLQTGKGASVAVTFVDKTNFSLGEDARMAMNEFAYNPQTGKGQALLSVLQGSFSFVSGQVAKSGDDAIKVQMPTMTIGIRGTKVAGYAAAEGSESQVTLLPNDDGTVGMIIVFNRTSSYLITQANFTAYSTSVTTPFQSPTLLVNLSKYQDTLSTLQKAIQSQGDRAALEKQSPVDIALARALAEVQTAAGGDGGGGGGSTTLVFGDLNLTLVTFQSGGDLFAAIFTGTDPIKSNGGPAGSNNGTQGLVNQQLPAGPTTVVASSVITTEDSDAPGQVPPPEGSNPGALTFTLIVPPILGTVALSADGTFVYTPGTVLQALAQGQQAQDTFTIQITGGPSGTVEQVISVNITGENDAPVAGPSQGQAFEDQAGASAGNVLTTAADIDNGAVLQVVSVNGIAIGTGGGGGGGNGGGALQLTQTALNYLNGQGQSLVNGLGGNANFGEGTLARNDDGSTGLIDISSVFTGGLNFFGTVYTALYVNNNGNITFNGPLSQFTPSQISAGLGNPIIAPFWADVDTRGGVAATTPGGNSTGTNLVYYDLDVANHVFTVTWDDVGYFPSATNLQNAFQLQLIDRGNGDFDIVFRYESVNWTTGGASGGQGGLGGQPARAGYNSGNGEDFFELAGSGNQGQVLAWDELPGNSNQVGVYIFQVRGGEVVGGDGSVTIQTDYGTLVMNADGSYTYTPNNASPLVQALAQGEAVNDQFTYTVADEFGATSQTTLTVAVTGVNDAPVAVADVGAVDGEGGQAAGNVLANDTDVDNGAVLQAAAGVFGGIYGTLVLNADGSYVYTLNPQSAALQALADGEQSQDVFVYVVTDEFGGADSATLSITVTGSNDLPFANDDFIQAIEDGGPVAATYLFVLANDGDPDGALDIVAVSPLSAAGASVTLGEGEIVYDPGALFQSLAQGHIAVDSFTYTVSDADGAQATATVFVTVVGVNDAPIGVDDANAIGEDGVSVGGNVLANDADVDDGAVLQAVAGEFQGVYGTLVLNADGSYAYTLDPESGELQTLGQGEVAEESFVYTVTDGLGGSDTATLRIAVSGSNDPPFANDDFIQAVEDGGPVATAFFDLLVNDGDPEGNITIGAVSPVSALGASVAIVNGQVVYDSGQLFQSLAQGQSATDSFTYAVVDNFGAQAIGTVFVEVAGANDAPVALDDANAIGEDDALAAGNVLGNDADVDAGTVLQAVPGQFQGQFGTLALAANGAYTYTLNSAAAQSLAQGQQVEDAFVYTATDGQGGSDTATLAIAINGANDLPLANPDFNAITEGTASVAGNLLANDTDADNGAVLHVSPGAMVINSQYGSLSVQADGSYTYTLNNGSPAVESLAQGQSVSDVFFYVVADQFGVSGGASLTITISGANDAPVVEAGRTLKVSDDAGPVALMIAAPTDIDAGDVLTVMVTGVPTNGTIRLANGDAVANGQPLTLAQLAGLTFTPSDGNTGASSSFTYTVADNHGAAANGTVAIETIDANHVTVVGYYDMADGQGDPTQLASIQANGFTAVNITEPTAAQLAGVDLFYVQNPFNNAYGAEYLAHLADIAAAVANGMTLVIHDRYVAQAESILPNGGQFDILRDDEGIDIDVLAPGSLLVNGPGGVITDATLDFGSFSTHGYAIAGSLSEDAVPLLSTEDPSHVAAFSYAFGEGHVFYSTIPLDFYLAGQGLGAVAEAFQDIYAPNAVAYGASLGGVAEGHVFTGSAGNDVLVGGGGGDTLVGNGGQDAIFGGAGDDRIVVKDLGFLKVDGGAGNDVLAFDIDGTIDLSAIPAGRFAGIERLDLTDGRAGILGIGMDQVLALNSEHQGPANTAENALKVLGDAGDVVQLFGDWQAGGQDSAGQGFQLYTLGDAKVAVEQQDLQVQVIN